MFELAPTNTSDALYSCAHAALPHHGARIAPTFLTHRTYTAREPAGGRRYTPRTSPNSLSATQINESGRRGGEAAGGRVKQPAGG